MLSLWTRHPPPTPSFVPQIRKTACKMRTSNAGHIDSDKCPCFRCVDAPGGGHGKKKRSCKLNIAIAFDSWQSQSCLYFARMQDVGKSMFHEARTTVPWKKVCLSYGPKRTYTNWGVHTLLRFWDRIRALDKITRWKKNPCSCGPPASQVYFVTSQNKTTMHCRDNNQWMSHGEAQKPNLSYCGRIRTSNLVCDIGYLWGTRVNLSSARNKHLQTQLRSFSERSTCVLPFVYVSGAVVSAKCHCVVLTSTLTAYLTPYATLVP